MTNASYPVDVSVSGSMEEVMSKHPEIKAACKDGFKFLADPSQPSRSVGQIDLSKLPSVSPSTAPSRRPKI